MKKIFTAYLLLFCLVDFAAFGQDPFQDERSLWLEKAEMSIPKLTETVKSPKGVVTVGKDASAYQGWKVVVRRFILLGNIQSCFNGST